MTEIRIRHAGNTRYTEEFSVEECRHGSRVGTIDWSRGQRKYAFRAHHDALQGGMFPFETRHLRFICKYVDKLNGVRTR